ncbi:MAG: glycosyltransferase family A protein [Acidobacteriaceae bacterium]
MNLFLFRPAIRSATRQVPSVSLLIPARNEESNIAPLLESLFAQHDVRLQIIVCDDHSTDATAAIVRRLMAGNTSSHSLRLIFAPPLPEGWNGKQHACWTLAQHATCKTLCWVDADVRLAPDCIRHAHDFLLSSRSACASGFPHQQTGTFLERLLLPLIHFVLLGYLPILFMRITTHPAFAAGCGQLMLARRAPYFACHGHAAIAASRHDGITLPRVFRRAGFRTDLFPATDLAKCRMYHGAAQTWCGLLKNASEGMASPGAIFPFTLLLLCGQVIPFALLWYSKLFLLSAALALVTRLLCTLRFRQSWIGTLLHPLSVLLLLLLEWQALLMSLAGQRVSWRDRSYSALG